MRLDGQTVRYAAACATCKATTDSATPEGQRAWVKEHRCHG